MMGHAFDFPKVRQCNPAAGKMRRKTSARITVAAQIRSRRVLELFSDGMTRGDISAELGLHYETVSRIIRDGKAA
jgi:DNA-binding NarL/FixJ family response regulator